MALYHALMSIAGRLSHEGSFGVEVEEMKSNKARDHIASLTINSGESLGHVHSSSHDPSRF